MSRYILILLLCISLPIMAADDVWSSTTSDEMLMQSQVDPSPQVKQMASTTWEKESLGGITNRRNAEGDNPFGDNTIGGVENPDEPANRPVGDVPWFVLACMMGAYVIRKRMFAEGSLNK